SGCTPSANPRPWNPTRASYLYTISCEYLRAPLCHAYDEYIPRRNTVDYFRTGVKDALAMFVTGAVDQGLLLRNEYLVTENRILRNQLKGRVRLSDGERQALAEIGQKLGKKALAEVAKIVTPDTILAWHRKLVAQKCD